MVCGLSLGWRSWLVRKFCVWLDSTSRYELVYCWTVLHVYVPPVGKWEDASVRGLKETGSAEGSSLLEPVIRCCPDIDLWPDITLLSGGHRDLKALGFSSGQVLLWKWSKLSHTRQVAAWYNFMRWWWSYDAAILWFLFLLVPRRVKAQESLISLR